MLAHNGEINTIAGNRNWMRAREANLRSRVWQHRVERLKPVISPHGSDSASFDNALELLAMSRRDPLHAMMMLMPEAHENAPHMEGDLRGFYEYAACLTEPWDGPAGVAFSDGRFVAAALDRNGLRPARYAVTRDGLVVMASEAGAVHLDDERILEKGRLGPGQMIAVDTERGHMVLVTERRRLRPRYARIGDIRRALEINAGPQSKGERKDPHINRGPGNYVSAAMENLHRSGFFLQRNLHCDPSLEFKNLQ